MFTVDVIWLSEVKVKVLINMYFKTTFKSSQLKSKCSILTGFKMKVFT